MENRTAKMFDTGLKVIELAAEGAGVLIAAKGVISGDPKELGKGGALIAGGLLGGRKRLLSKELAEIKSTKTE